MPDEIDLSTYRRLDVSFTDGKGNDVVMLQFRDVEILPQLTLNVVDPSGVINSSFTVFDLPV